MVVKIIKDDIEEHKHIFIILELTVIYIYTYIPSDMGVIVGPGVL